MADIGDLVAHLTLDASGFTEPLEHAVNSINHASDSITERVDHQGQSWVGMAEAAVPRIADLTAATFNLAGGVAHLSGSFVEAGAEVGHSTALMASGAMNLGAAALNAASTAGFIAAYIGSGIFTVAGYMLKTREATKELTDSTKDGSEAAAETTSNWGSASQTLSKYGGMSSMVAGSSVANSAMMREGVAALNSEIVQGSIRAITSNEQVATSSEKLSASLTGLGAALSLPVQSAHAVVAALGGIDGEAKQLPTTFDRIASFVAARLDNASTAATVTGDTFTWMSDKASGIVLSLNNWDWTFKMAEGFAEQTKALRELGPETERVMALQASHASQYKNLGEVQAEASDRAAKAEEVLEIGHLKTASAVQGEISRYQQLYAAKIAALKVGEQLSAAEKKQMDAIFDALAKQKAGVGSGRISEKDEKEKHDPHADDATKMYERQEEALNKLKFGEEEAARMAIMSAHATDEEVLALLARHDEMVKLTEENKEWEKSVKLLKESEEKVAELKDQTALLMGTATKAEVEMQKMARAGHSQQQIEDIGNATANLEKLKVDKQGEERIASLRDEINMLVGSATKAEVEMQKLAKAGYNQDQIEEIGRLSEQLEELKEKDPKGSKSKKDGQKEIARGSSESASLVLRGISNGKPDKDKVGAEQLLVLKRIDSSLKKTASNQTHLIKSKIYG